MTELQIYRAFKEIEMHWHNDNSELYVMPNFNELSDCMSIFPSSLFDDGGLESRMNDRYIWFDLVPICDYFGLDAKEIFPPEETEK